MNKLGLVFTILTLSLTAVSAWQQSRSFSPRIYHLKKKVRQRGHLNGALDGTTPSEDSPAQTKRQAYDLGLGKNSPIDVVVQNWNVPEFIEREAPKFDTADAEKQQNTAADSTKKIKRRKMIAKDNESQLLRNALWDETHYSESLYPEEQNVAVSSAQQSSNLIKPPSVVYPNIDLSIPNSVYDKDNNIDVVWDLLRWEAFQQAQREPLLVSFLHSTILNHASLESSLAFLLANRLQSPMMISTQLQSLILQALDSSATFRRALRADMMAVRDRDPACNYLPDVFLYFKGFHALQSYRVAHELYVTGRHVLASFLQSQVSSIFQIDIHPASVLQSGIMLDHGTGIVIGETAVVGYNCSILHHVTLGGSGKKGLVRHPQVGNGVLLGAGATVLGPVTIGEGSQVGAGTLVISDLAAHCVAVGVPARIIGSFVDVTQQPSLKMDQMMEPKNIITFESENI